MSASHLSWCLHEQSVLGELLHSLSQPLTSLRCSLELSLDEAAEQQQSAVEVALEQTEKVIGMIQLMREYLDADQPEPENGRVLLERVLRTAVDDMASIADLRGIELQLEGSCSATVSVAEPRLRLALQYLISVLIDKTPEHGRILLRLREGSTESTLSAEVRETSQNPRSGVPTSQPHTVSIQETLRTARLAIARRTLEMGGTLLTIAEENHPGFLLRIPRMHASSCAVV